MVVAVVLSVPLAARADGEKSLKVGANEDYKTIQAAINYINEQESKTDWTIEVEAGTYDRFVVLSGLDNLTVKAAENADVTVNTLDGSKPEGVTFNSGNWMDLGGVQLWDADGVTLENLTFDIKSTSGLTHHMRAAISNHNEAGVYADNFVIRGCSFIGNGDMSGQGNGNVGISISKFSSFSIENCSFSNLMEGIRGQSDGANVGQVTISNNSFTNCSFAIHEYAGDSDRDDAEAGKGTYTFSNNTVTGTTNLYNKAYFEDLYVDDDKVESDGYTINVSGNTLTNAIIGLVNLETDGGATNDVLAGNTMSDNSFVVTGSKVSGQIEMHSNYAAPENGYGHWVWTGKEDAAGGGNPSDAAERIKAAIDEANAKGSHTLSFGVDNPDNFLLTFTWFKDMIYWVTDEEPVDPVPPEWENSKSKIATNLDENFESKVTLSLPAADYEAEVDVVLVIDVSSSMKEGDIAEAKSAAIAMCDELAAKDKLDVRIGVVTFDETAHNLTNGLVAIDEAKNAISGLSASEGTNMMAGLIAGKEMLDKGGADQSCKYMVLMSDGIPIYWMENGQPKSKTLESYESDKQTLISTSLAGSEPEGSIEGDAAAKYIDNMMSVNELMNKNDVESDSNTWKQVSDTGETFNSDEYRYTNIEKSTYMTGMYLQNEIFGKYGLKMVAFGTDKYENNVVYTWGENFCDWIGAKVGDSNYFKVSKPGYGGEEGDLTKAFEEIANDLVYLVDAGSTVKDVIGYGDDYNMDFLPGLDKVELSVDGVILDEKEIEEGLVQNETARFAFGEDDSIEAGYKYVLHYYANGENGSSDECFVWDINVPVRVDEPVQLTYTVKLANPKSDPGTYGKYDRDGSKNYPGLYTNNSATLYPVDSNGDEGPAEEFQKPTVSYTVDSVLIKPADITIYNGGNAGYEAAINGDTGATTGGSVNAPTLPDPGFYFDLPEAVNIALEKAGFTTTDANAADLTGMLHIYTKDENDNKILEWGVSAYGESSSVIVDNADGSRHLYRIDPANENTDQLRMKFINENDDVVTSDDFSLLDGSLSQTWNMLIYTEAYLDKGDIYVSIDVPVSSTNPDGDVTHFEYKLGALDPEEGGLLTIRTVTDSDVTSVNGVVNDGSQVGNDGAYAVISGGATYYVNSTNVDVEEEGQNYDAAPSLLFDEVVSDESVDELNGDGYGYNHLLEAAADEVLGNKIDNLENVQHESRYLDLVDANNGNTWLTTDSPVTIYWPKPEAAGNDASFYLVHFEGLDREMANSEVESGIAGAVESGSACEIQSVDSTSDPDNIIFTLNPGSDGRVSFSPFVLVWGASNGGSTDPEPPTPSDNVGDLKVSKTVTGNLANLNDEFTFRVTVEGAGDQTYGGVKFTNNVATITLNGGETVTIKNLPKGAKYTVEEIDGLDYELVSSKNTSGTIPDGSVTASFVNDKSEPETLDPTDPVNPGGSKVLLDADGNPVALSGGEFTFKLTGLDGAPMPADAVDGSITVTNRADGVFVFGDIVFDEAGTYTYELTEVAGTDEGIAYDGSTHTLVVVVSDEDADGDGKLDIASLTYDGESTLPTFTNETTSDEPPAPDPNQPGTDEPAEPTTPGVPDTGDHTVSALPAVLALGGVALVGGALAVARRRVR